MSILRIVCHNWSHETVWHQRPTGNCSGARSGIAAARHPPFGCRGAGRRNGAQRAAVGTGGTPTETQESQTRSGASPFLSPKQLRQLEKALDEGAYTYGYAEDYWTADRIGHVIWELFGVRYESSGVWRLLQRLGWSSQKPQRQALQRDDAAIRHWKRHVWPRI